MVTTDHIRKLREKTGISVMQCKKALEEAGGDMEKALALLSEKSKEIAEKKSERALKSGTVASYVHAGNTVGSMVELLCETDFVAKNEEFRSLAYEIAMHIAAMNPEDNEELLAQPYIKDQNKTVSDLVKEAVQKFGENIEVGRFSRFSI